jgi:hypothetical protein
MFEAPAAANVSSFLLLLKSRAFQFQFAFGTIAVFIGNFCLTPYSSLREWDPVRPP